MVRPQLSRRSCAGLWARTTFLLRHTARRVDVRPIFIENQRLVRVARKPSQARHKGYFWCLKEDALCRNIPKQNPGVETRQLRGTRRPSRHFRSTKIPTMKGLDATASVADSEIFSAIQGPRGRKKFDSNIAAQKTTRTVGKNKSCGGDLITGFRRQRLLSATHSCSHKPASMHLEITSGVSARCWATRRAQSRVKGTTDPRAGGRPAKSGFHVIGSQITVTVSDPGSHWPPGEFEILRTHFHPFLPPPP